jgi:hypothetical protein
VVNPSSDEVNLIRFGEIDHTVRLDDRNVASFRIDTLKKGNYHLHMRQGIGAGVHTIFIDPEDDIKVRLNSFLTDSSITTDQKAGKYINAYYNFIEKIQLETPQPYQFYGYITFQEYSNRLRQKLDFLCRTELKKPIYDNPNYKI